MEAEMDIDYEDKSNSNNIAQKYDEIYFSSNNLYFII